MIELFLSALALGFLFNAAPGAIFALSLKRGIQGGFWPAFHVQIGSLVGDLTWAVLGLGGAAVLFQIDAVRLPMAIFGGGLLAYLAYGSFKDAASPLPMPMPKMENGSDETTTASGQSLWRSVGGGGGVFVQPDEHHLLGGVGWHHHQPWGERPHRHGLCRVFLAGFMTSSVIWCFICAGFIAAVRHMISRRAWVVINLACGLGLLYFAINVAVSVWGVAMG